MSWWYGFRLRGGFKKTFYDIIAGMESEQRPIGHEGGEETCYFLPRLDKLPVLGGDYDLKRLEPRPGSLGMKV